MRSLLVQALLRNPFLLTLLTSSRVGRSNALNIAERLGLDGRIISEARSLHGEANLEASEVSWWHNSLLGVIGLDTVSRFLVLGAGFGT